MVLDIDPSAVRTGLWYTAALAVNQFFIQMGQGGSKFPAGQRPPEDKMLSLAKAAKKKYDVDQSMGCAEPHNEQEKEARVSAERWTRIGNNWLENAPLGLVVAWASMLLASKDAYHQYFFLAFVVSRWLHTITYWLKLQPWRAFAWLGSWIGVIGMLARGLTA